MNKQKLSKIGTIELIKSGIVFTLVMSSTSGFNLTVFEKINEAIPDVIQSYPEVEAIKISDNHLFLVLKPKTKGE